MPETAAINQLLHRAHLFITEGQEEEALATLERIQTEDVSQKREVAYLRAWCYTLCRRWDEAAQFLLDPDITQENSSDIQAFGQTERRRRASYLLLLGNIAANLGRYEEATRHYSQCIKFLDERRMNIVSVRIKARCGLGTAYTQTGFYHVALSHYEDALRLCGDDAGHPDLPDICHGLCDTHRHMEHFDQAMEYGKKALKLYIDRNDKYMEGRIRNVLGRICYQKGDFQAASYYFTEALTLAMSVNRPGMIIVNLTALADVRLDEGLLDEAQRYCEHAFEYQDRALNNHMLGAMYIVGGKVAEARANQASGQEKQDLVQEAIARYKEAEGLLLPLQARVELSEVYGRLAQILETSGQQDQAIGYWKSAYSLYAQLE